MTSIHAPRLHAALDYCARKLLSELQRMPDASPLSGPDTPPGTVLAHRLTATTATLLRWWCSAEYCTTRVENFHAGQRQAIVHAVLAHEVLQSDDPEWLYRLACTPALAMDDAPVVATASAQYASYLLRMAPGTGLRWVAQGLLVWQWANHVAAHARGRPDPRFGGDFTLMARDRAVQQRLEDALLGPVDHKGHRDATRSSLLRHAPLFLPPSLRRPLCDWLELQARCADGDGALRIIEAVNEGNTDAPPITLVAGVGARMLGAGSKHAHAGRTSPHHASLLWIDLALTQTGGPIGTALSKRDSTAIAECPLEPALRNGAVKLPMLEPTQQLQRMRLRTRSPRSAGLRPQISRAHRSLLQIGVDALLRRETGFAALDPARVPKLLVLCDTPQLIRGVQRCLRQHGLDAHAQAARVIIDGLPAQGTVADARICVIVVLRTCNTDHAPAGLLAPAIPLLWPEPDIAALCTENRERAALGRAPAHLLDVLSVIDHPQCHPAYAALLRAGLAVQGDDQRDIQVTGDLIVSGLRADADAFDIAMPYACEHPAAAMREESLSDVPQRILRARQSMPVRKSIYRHAGWSDNDSGLRRAIVECAEHDPKIESHCLLDPRRHAARSRDALLMQGIAPHGFPDAVIRTPDAVYLVEILPSSPLQSRPLRAGERALMRWCALTNALPLAQRQHRSWHRVQLHAPLFWSWKRSEGALSALLAALAGTAPFARRAGAR